MPYKKTPWWKGAVLYQIYPRSFLDTNGDGIGDLRGCIQKLDYISALGVDAVWLSPFFPSPMDDFGYDVADYCDVDPIFGTLTDFDAFIAAAHERGIKVVIDQVYSHSSDQHAWFQESRRDKTNAKADWYVWADPKADGSPPNNWQSVFGGGAWEWDARRGQYYFHNFLTSQPDLNLHNIDVQNALLDVARFWLDRGVNGFRLDAINFAMHDPLLRDNPITQNSNKVFTRPFDYQDQVYSQSHDDITLFLKRIRSLTDMYDDIFTVAEVPGPDPLKEMKAFTQADTHLNAAYSFDFLYAPSISEKLIKQASLPWQDDDGWVAWAFSNHDSPRSVSRWAGTIHRADFAKITAMVLLMLRGNPILFQGEELGLEQVEIAFEDLKDPEAIKNWPETLGRDGARTPMPWSKDASFLGFSDTKPWLPPGKAHETYAVSDQEGNPDSPLNFIRNLIKFRKNEPALVIGEIHFLDAPDGLLAFRRQHENEQFLIVANFTDREIAWQAPVEITLDLLMVTNKAQTEITAAHGCVLPGSGYIARLSK